MRPAPPPQPKYIQIPPITFVLNIISANVVLENIMLNKKVMNNQQLKCKQGMF